jgi:hypothetical protein
MLCVLVALVYLYASAGVHRQLVHQRETLTAAGTLETEARQLGMMRSGEQPYVVGGLPDN